MAVTYKHSSLLSKVFYGIRKRVISMKAVQRSLTLKKNFLLDAQIFY